MSGQKCKSAIDCNGFICELQNTVLLIVTDNITDPEAIDAFNQLKEKMSAKYEQWKETYIDFDS